MDKINRLRVMAQEALFEYEASLTAGGEPVYPDWADDLLEVCEQAEAGFRFQQPASFESSHRPLYS